MHKIYFNNKKQYLKLVIEDVHPDTFAKRGGGRWGYFLATWENPTKGEFGEIHLVKRRIRSDVVVHEVFHFIAEVLKSKEELLTDRNEERYAKLSDYVFRKISKKLLKIYPEISNKFLMFN